MAQPFELFGELPRTRLTTRAAMPSSGDRHRPISAIFVVIPTPGPSFGNEEKLALDRECCGIPNIDVRESHFQVLYRGGSISGVLNSVGSYFRLTRLESEQFSSHLPVPRETTSERTI